MTNSDNNLNSCETSYIHLQLEDTLLGPADDVGNVVDISSYLHIFISSYLHIFIYLHIYISSYLHIFINLHIIITSSYSLNDNSDNNSKQLCTSYILLEELKIQSSATAPPATWRPPAWTRRWCRHCSWWHRCSRWCPLLQLEVSMPRSPGSPSSRLSKWTCKHKKNKHHLNPQSDVNVWCRCNHAAAAAAAVAAAAAADSNSMTRTWRSKDSLDSLNSLDSLDCPPPTCQSPLHLTQTWRHLRKTWGKLDTNLRQSWH